MGHLSWRADLMYGPLDTSCGRLSPVAADVDDRGPAIYSVAMCTAMRGSLGAQSGWLAYPEEAKTRGERARTQDERDASGTERPGATALVVDGVVDHGDGWRASATRAILLCAAASGCR